MRRLILILLCCLSAFGFSGRCLSERRSVADAKEFNAAVKHLQPGDTLELANGTWTDANLVFRAYGSEKKPIVVRAATSGGVKLTGTSTLRIGGEWLIAEGLLFEDGEVESAGESVVEFRTRSDQPALNCRLTNSAIINYNPRDKHFDYKWVSLYGRNNRVDSCTFVGKNHQGTLLVVWLDSLPNYHRIDHNYFGPRPEHDQNGAEIIRVGTSDWSMFTSKTVVEDNLFERCNGELEIISNKSCENVYRNNTFRESAGALTLRHGNRCEVYGNWFFGNGKKNTGGVRIIGENHKVYNNWFQELKGNNRFSPLPVMDGVQNSPLNGYFQVKNARVVHNTFVRCDRGIVLGQQNTDYSGFLPADTLVVMNNVFAEVAAPITSGSNPNAPIFRDNAVSGTKELTPSGFNDTEMTIERDEAGVLRVAGAPMASQVFPFVTTDIDGVLRAYAVRLGADETTAGTPLNHPLTRSEVGARWWKE